MLKMLWSVMSMHGDIIEDAKFLEGLSSYATHSHNCYEIIYIKEGNLSINISDKQYDVKAPSLIFVSKLEQHSLSVKGNAYKRYYLCISPILAGNMIRDYSLLTVLSNRPEDFCHILDVSLVEKQMDKIFSDLIFEHENQLPYSTERQTSLLLELLITIYRLNPNLFSNENDKSISVIWKIQCRLEQNCNEHFTLASLAEEYHMSTCYLSHLFKKVTGYPLMQYLTMCRLSLARQLLSESNLSITDIVYNTGFSDSSNFARLFKREMNLTPKEFRRKYKK